MLKIEQSVVDATQAVGAETLLRVLGPIIEKRLENIVKSIIVAPENALPGLRGQLYEVWNILESLRDLAAKKRSANEAITKAFAASE